MMHPGVAFIAKHPMSWVFSWKTGYLTSCEANDALTWEGGHHASKMRSKHVVSCPLEGVWFPGVSRTRELYLTSPGPLQRTPSRLA